MNSCTWLIVRVAENLSQREWSHYMRRAWLPGMPPPPWSGDNDAMRDWVFHQLDNFYRSHREELLKEATDPESGDATILELLDSSDDSRRAHGMVLLRQLVSRVLGPEFGDRIKWTRNRGHPKRQPQYSSSESVKGRVRRPIDVSYDYRAKVHMAKRAVPIIQKFWRENYNGKWHRSSGNIDAYKIAAAYFFVDDEDVRRKPSGRHKKPRAK
jgi:hypothetical protein